MRWNRRIFLFSLSVLSQVKNSAVETWPETRRQGNELEPLLWADQRINQTSHESNTELEGQNIECMKSSTEIKRNTMCKITTSFQAASSQLHPNYFQLSYAKAVNQCYGSQRPKARSSLQGHGQPHLTSLTMSSVVNWKPVGTNLLYCTVFLYLFILSGHITPESLNLFASQLEHKGIFF